MSNVFELADMNLATHTGAVIKVLGVGGGGCNAIEHMVASNMQGVEFICANTDVQALQKMSAPTCMRLGSAITRGLGAGANPEVGRQAAVEDRDRLREAMQGADMVFIAAGMGGGTGTGGAPVIAEVAREMGILTVGVVTKPFSFEGKRRCDAANQGISALAQHVDSLITIPNDRLLAVLGKVTLMEAFSAANNVLLGAVRGIADMILRQGFINVDFADVRTVMSEQGMAMMGSGRAAGEDRARKATELAIHSPLLEDIKLQGARGVLVSIAANSSLGIDEFHTVGEIVHSFADESANVVVGTILDESMEDEILVTVVATGLTQREAVAKSAQVDARRTRSWSSAGLTGAAVALSGEGGGMEAPRAAVRPAQDYSGFDVPSAVRQAASEPKAEPKAAETAATARRDISYLNIPAFLRKQAD